MKDLNSQRLRIWAALGSSPGSSPGASPGASASTISLILTL